ncbi:MAG: TIR domain-containing protein [Caldimonas sp.]
MTAGRREPESAKRDYSLAVRSFNWQDFFYNWKGDLFFDWLRRQLRNPETGYDVVLVDSRTGVTEMGGVCAYQLADVAVLLCAPNYQNLDGTLDVVRDFRSESVRALRRGRPLEILALPARLEANHAGRAAFLALFKTELGVEGLPAALAAAGLDYEKLALPYLPQFAVAEHLVGEAQPDKGGLVPVIDVFERLADALTLLAEADTPLGRQRGEALARLTGGITQRATGLVADTSKSSAGYDAYIDYCRDDRKRVDELVWLLERAGHRSFLDVARIEAGHDWESAIEQALAYSAVLLVCFGQPTDTEQRARTIALARRLQTVKIIPVLLPGSDERVLASFDLGRQQAVDLREWGDEAARAQLLSALGAAVGTGSRPSESAASALPERDPYPGAQAFGEDDAAYFFGREPEIDRLVEALGRHDVVWVTGAAQVGKTSLLLAGLLPRLRRMAVEGAALRVERTFWFDLSGWTAADTAGWSWASGENPKGELGLLLIDGLDTFHADGRASNRALRLATMERVFAGATPPWKVLLITRDTMSTDERAAVLGGLRERSTAVIEIQALAGTALRQAIEEPARRAAHLLEPGLAERLIESAGEAHSAISQIQLALATIWPERKRGWLTNKNLDAAGHLGGIAAGRRRETLGTLHPPELAATRVLFSRLVSLSSTYSVVACPQAWETIVTVPAIERVDAVALRDRLASAGLIDLYSDPAIEPLRDAPARELQVALTRPDGSAYLNDAGAPLDLRFLLWRDPLASQAWRWDGFNRDALLRGSELSEAQHWLAESVDLLTRREREFIDASTTARDAEQHEQDAREDAERARREGRERERREAAEALAAEQGERLKVEEEAARKAQAYAARLKRGGRWLVGLLAGSVLMSALALFQTVRETKARAEAVESAQAAQTEALKANAEAESKDAAAKRASDALKGTQAALDITEQARRAVEASLAARNDQERRQANEQLRSVDSKLVVAQAGIAKVQESCPVGRRLYLHIAQESDRAAARATVPVLQKQGFIVPGIELVKEAPRISDVRYFRREDEAAAGIAARALQNVGLRTIQPKFIGGYETSAELRPCHYEAWFSADALPKSKG